MSQKLTNTKTQKLESVNITSINIDYIADKTTITYVVYLDTGAVYKRGTLIEEGTKLLNNKSAYARMKTHVDSL